MIKNKKRYLLILLTLFLLILSSCMFENTYSISFNSNVNFEMNSKKIKENGYLYTPNEPTFGGYSFDGWYLDEDFEEEVVFPLLVNSNLTIYLKWDINQYKITYYDEYNLLIDETYLDYNEVITYLDYDNKEGYVFLGWYDLFSDTLINFEKMPSYNLELYPKFQREDELYEHNFLINQVVNNNLFKTVQLIKNNQTISNGVIFKKEKEENINTYYLITTYHHTIDYIDEIKIKHFNNEKTYEINKYGYNTNLDLLIISFQSVNDYPIASISNYELDVGMNTISISKISKAMTENSPKLGMISSVSNDLFYFDTKMSIGDIGSPLYSLDGKLLGIFISYVDKFETNYYASGVNLALNLSYYSSYLNNISNHNLLNSNIDILVNTDQEKYVSNDEYELYQIDVSNSLLNSNTYIKDHNLIIYSATLINKIDDYYLFITKYNDNFDQNLSNLQIVHNNVEYQIDSHYYSKKIGFSLFKVKTTNNIVLPIISNSELEVGMNLLVGGIMKNNYLNRYYNSGIVSKNNYNDYYFMIDGQVNYYQMGSSIYNYNGELIGMLVNKTYQEIGEETLIVDSISHAVDINKITNYFDNLNEEHNLDLLNIDQENKSLDKYISNTNYELTEINLINNFLKYVVNVKTGSGHGSGTLFKKEQYDDENYLYYVLTNRHVIEKDEGDMIVKTSFKTSYTAKDYYIFKVDDLAVIRFISNKNYEVIDIKANTSNYSLHQGDIVYAVGTPIDLSYFNYVTKGVITNTSYNDKSIIIDAGLNPGNSGGPLFSSKGHFIGVNTAKIRKSETYNKTDFARGIGISINLLEVYQDISNIKNYIPYTRKARLGITVMAMSDYLKNYDDNYFDRSFSGIVVTDVEETRSSYGILEVYDNIIEVNGIKIIDNDTVAQILANAKAGDEFTIKIRRKIDGIFVTKDVIVTFS